MVVTNLYDHSHDNSVKSGSLDGSGISWSDDDNACQSDALPLGLPPPQFLLWSLA
eukprot:SAG31_NODE_35586_length_321_cov_1.635135_1_plen_54_part_10